MFQRSKTFDAVTASQEKMAEIYLSRELGLTKSRAKRSPYDKRCFSCTADKAGKKCHKIYLSEHDLMFWARDTHIKPTNLYSENRRKPCPFHYRR